MGNIVSRPETGKLFFDFRYRGKRCREQTSLENTVVNRKKLEKILVKIEAEITLGTFEYIKYFPNSPTAREFIERKPVPPKPQTPLFFEFAKTWVLIAKQMRATFAHRN